MARRLARRGSTVERFDKLGASAFSGIQEVRQELHKYDNDAIFTTMDETHELMGRPDSASEAVFGVHVPHTFFFGRQQQERVSESHARAHARTLSHKPPPAFSSHREEAEARGPGLYRPNTRLVKRRVRGGTWPALPGENEGDDFWDEGWDGQDPGGGDEGLNKTRPLPGGRWAPLPKAKSRVDTLAPLPGPGAYQPKPTTASKGARWKPQTAAPSVGLRAKRNLEAVGKPGPGEYGIHLRSGIENLPGKFSTSDVRTSDYRRTAKQTALTPGPGAYKLPSVGDAAIGGGKISSSQRFSRSDEARAAAMPGPGQYGRPLPVTPDKGFAFNLSSPESETDRLIRDSRTKPGPGQYYEGVFAVNPNVVGGRFSMSVVPDTVRQSIGPGPGAYLHTPPGGRYYATPPIVKENRIPSKHYPMTHIPPTFSVPGPGQYRVKQSRRGTRIGMSSAKGGRFLGSRVV